MATKNEEEYGLPSLSIVLGYLAVKELKNNEDRLRVLDQLGYGNAEIAKICGLTPASVRSYKSKIKRERGKKR